MSMTNKGKVEAKTLPTGHMVIPETVEWHVHMRSYDVTVTLPGTSATDLHEKFEAPLGYIPWVVPDVCDTSGVWCWAPLPPEGRYFRAHARVLVPYPAFVHATRMGWAEGGKVWFPLWWHQVREDEKVLTLLPKHCMDYWAVGEKEVVDRWGGDKFWLPYPEARARVVTEFTEAYTRALSLKSGGSYDLAASLVGASVATVKSAVRNFAGYAAWGKYVRRSVVDKLHGDALNPKDQSYTPISPETLEELRRQLEGVGKK